MIESLLQQAKTEEYSQRPEKLWVGFQLIESTRLFGVPEKHQ
jgi:hypothetical protein